MQYTNFLSTLRQNFKVKGLNSLHASAAIWAGGILALGTGFWLYSPAEKAVDLLPETGIESGATLTVCPTGSTVSGCQYFGGDGIQQALDIAAEGDTVLVKEGEYTDVALEIGVYNNTIKKNVTLRGEKKPVLKGRESALAIAIGGSNQNFTVDGFVIQDAGVYAIFVGETAQVTISNNNIIDSHSYGIVLSGTANAVIKNNTISRNISSTLLGIGIQLDNSANATIFNNIISGTGMDQGIVISHAAQASIRNNTIDSTKAVGIFIYSTGAHNPAVTVVNNIITGTRNGLGLGYGIGGAHIHETGDLDNDVFKHNLVWGNVGDNTSCNVNEICANIDQGRVYADPQFVSATDYHLQSGSPAINAGDPSILDADGSRSDIGAYGGTGACGLDSNLPGCTAAPKNLSVTCTNGTAQFRWTGDANVTKYILRVNHEPTNTAQCINPNNNQPVGWACTPAATTQCQSSRGCDDRYVVVTASGIAMTQTVSLRAGESYSWSVANQVNGTEGASAGHLETNPFTCSGTGVTAPPTVPPTITSTTGPTLPPSTQCKAMDVNSDGKFNITDLASFAQNYPNRTCTKPAGTAPACGWEDINGDTKIDIADFASFAQRYYTHHASCAL